MRIRFSFNKKKRTLAALIFESAKVVLTGIPHPKWAREMARRVVRRLPGQQLGIYGLHVTNIVGSHQHPHRLAIERMFTYLRVNKKKHNIAALNYDPTIFPALRIKIQEEEGKIVSCLLYINGRVILTGLRDQQNLFSFFSHTFLPLLNQFHRE